MIDKGNNRQVIDRQIMVADVILLKDAQSHFTTFNRRKRIYCYN